MSKVQVRVAFKDLKELSGTGKKVNFVLKNGQVINAEILDQQKDQLKVKNALGHKSMVSFKEIREIWLDKKAPVYS